MKDHMRPVERRKGRIKKMKSVKSRDRRNTPEWDPFEVWRTRVKTGRPRYPSADVLLELAAQRAQRSGVEPSAEVRPLYLRQPDTDINWKTFRTEGVWPQ